VFSMQQDCRNKATMAISTPLTNSSESGAPRRGRWTLAAPEYYALAVILSVGLATYIYVTGRAQSERLLTPGLVAAIMVANLVPAMALIVLIGSRVARARAMRSMVGGRGRLHVRLVALFSLIAAAPTLLVVIFASLLFQFGVDFWYSDRSRGMFENAASMAQAFYEDSQKKLGAHTQAMAVDLSNYLKTDAVDSARFNDAYLSQVVIRELNESAIIEVGADGIARDDDRSRQPLGGRAHHPGNRRSAEQGRSDRHHAAARSDRGGDAVAGAPQRLSLRFARCQITRPSSVRSRPDRARRL
jgi:two-component system nitrogen regulation sensor histidine kinase NtrY